jgi:hypothetical protein
MKEVCSPLNKPRGGSVGDPGKLVKVKHTAIYNNDVGPSKLAPGGPRPPAGEPDPFPAASRTGGTISVTSDILK